MTGAAKSRFSAGGFGITNSVEVLQNERMVGLDFKRTIAPGLAPCLRRLALSAFPSGASAPPTKRLPLSHIGSFSAAFRVVVRPAPGASQIIVDTIIAARGRTEISLVGSGPGDMSTLEKALVRTLVGRARA